MAPTANRMGSMVRYISFRTSTKGSTPSASRISAHIRFTEIRSPHSMLNMRPLTRSAGAVGIDPRRDGAASPPSPSLQALRQHAPAPVPSSGIEEGEALLGKVCV